MKNIELNQEFHFCHPSTKVKMNSIYNFYFTGSSFWDLFSREAIMLENSWNTSVCVMFDLLLQTHRYLIESISLTKQLKIVLMERFSAFLTKQIIQRTKFHLLAFIKHDVWSTTGSNLQNILLLTNKHTVKDLCKDDIKKLKYTCIEDKNIWNVNFIHEITDVKFNELEV